MTGGALRLRPALSERNGPMPNPVKIIAILTALPGKAEDLRALLEGMTEPSRAEAGNLRYDLWQDQAEPGRFVLDELYVDAAAVATHRETPHFQTYLATISQFADRTALVLDPAHIA